MAVISQNGWQAATTYTGHGIPLVPLRWVTGSVRAGDVHTVLDYLGKRFNAEVEPIRKAHSWGFAPRQIRGASTTLSNHASGTAVDFNAPDHGIGLSGTFSPAQRRAIERILSDLGGTVRWGGHYSGRKDEMHFEINTSAAALARVADKVRKGNLATTPAPAPTPISAPTEDTLSKAEVDEIKQYLHALLIGGYTSDGQQFPGMAKVDIETQRRIDAIPEKVWAHPLPASKVGSNTAPKEPAHARLARIVRSTFGLKPKVAGAVDVITSLDPAEVDAKTLAAELAAALPRDFARQVAAELTITTKEN